MPLSLTPHSIRLALFDVDGVLTDGRLPYGDAGEVMKAFDVRDGLGMKLLQNAGVELAIITSRCAEGLRLRARDLGITHLHQGVDDKRAAFDALLAGLRLAPEQTAFLGDDLVDLPVMTQCGFSATVADAPAVLKRHADYVTLARGGRGAAREFCEVILHRQGLLRRQVARFLPGRTGDYACA